MLPPMPEPFLELVDIEGGAHEFLQLGRKLFLGFDLLEDIGLALEHRLHLLLGLDHLLDHDLVHIPRLLFSVPRDEGHRGAFFR